MPAGLPTSITVAVEFTAGVWTALTDVVGDSIEIRVGRENAASDIQPGTLSFAVDNIDGKYTPDNPTSSLYPNWVEGKRVRMQTVVGGITYTRFVGRITRIEPDFPTVPWSGRCVVTAVDLLGDLQRVKLRQWGVDSYARYESPMYWVLDDTSGAAQPAAVGAQKLTVRRTLTGASVDFASESGLDVDGTSYVRLTNGASLRHANQGFTPFDLSGNYAGGYFKLTEGDYGTLFALSSGPFDPVGGTHWYVEYTASGLRLVASGGGATGYVMPPDFGWLGIVASQGFGNLGLDVWSTETGDGVIASGAGSGVTVDRVTIGGDLSLAAARFYIGETDEPQTNVWGTAQQAGSLALNAGLDPGGTVQWTTSNLTEYTTPASRGRTAFDVLLDLARSESGIAYHDYSTAATQVVKLVSNADSRPASVALTVDADADLDGGPVLERRIDGYVTSATAKSSRAAITVTDSTAADVVGNADVEVSTLAATDEALTAIAQDAIAQGKDNRLRVSQMTVDLSTAANNLYAAFYAITPGERVRLSNLPSAYFGVTYMDGYVEGWTERPGVTGYQVTFDLSPADAPPEGIWDDSTYGRWGFGDGVATNSSSATAVATSVAFQWTGGLTLSTSAGDYPLDLDWNGERVTVTSAPAGGSSPQTLTITRGVAPTVARAHNAGEPVDIWNAARWAM